MVSTIRIGKLQCDSQPSAPLPPAFDSAYNIIQNGENQKVDGTSAACPVWAGIVALLNDQRMAAGLPTMGFMNPFLSVGINNNFPPTQDLHRPDVPTVPTNHTSYSLTDEDAAFTDITTGANNVESCGPVRKNAGALPPLHDPSYPSPHRPTQPPQGFYATAGWDAATGLGTPLFGGLQTAAMASAAN